ncbi:histidine kinase dimerization/phospho-acceptor domain-containing protein [Marinibactrum halimedae]|uniref:histidine kinase n=1 Tax=Marinibactrum halimedae TaxID=1444977 RepID=A0AA37T5M3_9GAMM|nr:histidine kinase dimerization/phospho-acceptor domain-containing protein [Marinibactrum halimedae]MCD9458374.1 ATP-binding protein [Marinibactrum halimedae]GLS26071.1 hypothetical protein GCM10007877_17860 [Marinibactrum halimedae]
MSYNDDHEEALPDKEEPTVSTKLKGYRSFVSAGERSPIEKLSSSIDSSALLSSNTEPVHDQKGQSWRDPSPLLLLVLCGFIAFTGLALPTILQEQGFFLIWPPAGLAVVVFFYFGARAFIPCFLSLVVSCWLVSDTAHFQHPVFSRHTEALVLCLYSAVFLTLQGFWLGRLLSPIRLNPNYGLSQSRKLLWRFFLLYSPLTTLACTSVLFLGLLSLGEELVFSMPPQSAFCIWLAGNFNGVVLVVAIAMTLHVFHHTKIRHYFFHVVPYIVVAAVISAVFISSRHTIITHQRNIDAERTRGLSHEIETAITQNVQVAQILGQFVRANAAFSEEDFHHFITRYYNNDHHLASHLWLKKIEDDELQNVKTKVLDLHPGGIHSAEPAKQYLVVSQKYPQHFEAVQLGWNLLADYEYFTLFENAVEVDGVAVSPDIQLADDERYIAFAYPVYEKDSVKQTITSSEASLSSPALSTLPEDGLAINGAPTYRYLPDNLEGIVVTLLPIESLIAHAQQLSHSVFDIGIVELIGGMERHLYGNPHLLSLYHSRKNHSSQDMLSNVWEGGNVAGSKGEGERGNTTRSLSASSHIIRVLDKTWRVHFFNRQYFDVVQKTTVIASLMMKSVLFMMVCVLYLFFSRFKEAELFEKGQSREASLAKILKSLENERRLKTEFLNSLSHQLRVPLNSVIGFSHRLLKQPEIKRDPHVSEGLDAIHRNGLHLLALVDEILDLSTIESGSMVMQKHQVDMRTLMGELRKYAVEINTRKSLKLNFSTEVKFVWGDRLRLRQMMFSLVGSAIDVTEAGWVTLTVTSEYQNSKGGVLFKVSDSGLGEAAEARRAQFQRFSELANLRAKGKKVNEASLRLVLVHEFAELHGGRAWVNESPDSEFCIWIPTPVVAMTEEDFDDSGAKITTQGKRFSRNGKEPVYQRKFTVQDSGSLRVSQS